MYAIVGPFSSGQSRNLETLKFDEDRVEYAKINYNVIAQNCSPVSPVGKGTDEGIISYSLVPRSIPIQIFRAGNGPGDKAY